MKTLIALCIFAAATGARADGYGFRTPSGNIYCNGSLAGGPQGSSDISCSIVERGGPPAWPDPGSGPGVWGHHFDLGSTGPARVVCSGPLPHAVKLAADLGHANAKIDLVGAATVESSVSVREIAGVRVLRLLGEN